MSAESIPGRSAIGGIARSGSANLMAAGIGSAANLLIIVIITRGWSPALAGAFFAVTSIFLLTLSLVELGVDQGFVRFQARNIALGRMVSNRRILRVGYLSVSGVSVVAAGVMALLAGQIARLVADAETYKNATLMVQILIAALPVAAAYDLLLAQTRGRSYMRPTILIERICRPLLQVLLLIVVILAGHSDPALLAAAWVVPYSIGLLVLVVWARRLPASQDDTAPVVAPDEHPVQEFWKFTAPRGVARFFQVGLQRADIAIVAALAGPAASAVYAAATRFLVVGQVATQALQQVSEPHLARLIALDQHHAVRYVYHQLTLWSIALTWPLYLLVAIFAEPLLTVIFGTHYAQGHLTLTVLSLTMLFATAMGPVDVLLLMAGRSGLSLINTGTALVIDVVGCIVLIPLIGIEGAALAWAVAIITRNVMGMIQVSRQLHMTPFTLTSARMGMTCLVLFGVFPATVSLLTGSTAALLAIVIGCAVAYAVVVWRKRDSLALRDLIRRRRSLPSTLP